MGVQYRASQPVNKLWTLKVEQKNKQSVESPEHSVETQEHHIDFKSDFGVDFRQRIDLFAKTLLLAAAGALTVSISLFLKDKAPTIPFGVVSNLQLAWGLLFYTIIAISVGHFMLVLQGHHINSHWDGKLPLENDPILKNQAMKNYRLLISVIGLSGFVAFIVGIFLLAFVTMRTIAVVSS